MRIWSATELDGELPLVEVENQDEHDDGLCTQCHRRPADESGWCAQCADAFREHVETDGI